ncbi:polysaccharide deacetylase [Paenibacillus beijingensis]|uniref:polysaccharide deacetylase n=1 Tax=Paenibacillus beijingensis TaxID=1126833 RepID=UPI0006992282|nr:polysaccharide deacetylase [Paenibacillus beijingensis]
MRAWLRITIGAMVLTVGMLGTAGALGDRKQAISENVPAAESAEAVYANAAEAPHLGKETGAAADRKQTEQARVKDRSGESSGIVKAASLAAGAGSVPRMASSAGAKASGERAPKTAAVPKERVKTGQAKGGGRYDRPQQPTVYLTFDDGPSANTVKVLDILKKNGIQASFFMVGEHVEGNPKLVQRVKAEGHTIGNHTYDHVYKELYGNFSGFAAQIGKTEAALAKQGVVTRFVRAPGGTYSNFDKGYFDAMKQAGYVMVDWNVDSGDSKRVGVPASEIVSNIRHSKLAHELILLMHDGSGHDETVKALQETIDYYKNKGYQFAPLTERVKPVVFPVAKKLKWARPAPTSAQVAGLVRQAPAVWRTAAVAGSGTGVWQGAGSGQEAGAAGPGKLAGAGKVAGATGSGTVAGTGQGAGAAGSGPGKKAGTAVAGKGPGSGTSPAGGNGEAQLAAADLGLAVRALGQTVDFADGEFALRNDRWNVPVRKLVEALGGQVAWNAADRTVTVSLAGGEGVILPDKMYELQAGTMNAPVKDVLRLFGLELATLTEKDGQREIWAVAA